MDFKKTCNALIGKLFDSKETKNITPEELEKNRNINDAFYEKQKSYSELKDGVESKTIVDIIKQGFKGLNNNLFKTDFSYLVDKDYASVKYDIKTLQSDIQTSATRASETIHQDFRVTYEEDGKQKTKMLDNDSMVDISLYISSANNIAMYEHMQDEVRDYDGIYFQNDFQQLLEDGSVNKKQREELKSMYADKYLLVKDYFVEKRKSEKGKEELSNRELSNIEQLAHKEAINYTYIEGFLRGYNKHLQDKVFNNSNAFQVYKNIMETRQKITENSSDAMRKAGRSIDQLFIFSPEQYYRAVFKDLKNKEMYGRRDIFAYTETGTSRQGTTKSPNTNFYVSELSYRTLMVQETAKAEFMNQIRNNPKHDKTHELVSSMNNEIEDTLKGFSDKINNKELNNNELVMLATYVNKFNRLIGTRYEDLAILNTEDIYAKNKYVIDGRTKVGNVFEQLQDYINVAINNEKVLIEYKINQGEYDDMFKKYPQFKYLKDGNVTERDYIMFGRFFAKHENKKTNPVKFSKFRELQQGLRNSTLSLMNFDFQRDVLENIAMKDGVRRVLVNDLGTSLRTNSNIDITLDDISKDAHLNKDEDAQMRKEYQKEYESNLDKLSQEFGQDEDVEFESIETFGNEASLLAIDTIQNKYETQSFKSLYYADARNATALTKQELQKIFLSNVYSDDDSRDVENQIKATNSFVQDVLDGNIRLIDAEVARAIGEVQTDMIKQEYTKDGKGMKAVKEVTRWSKFGLLYSPFRFPKFMLNNAIGDFMFAMYNRPEIAMQSLLPNNIKNYLSKYYNLNGEIFNEDEQYFLDHSQGFQRLNYNDLLGNLDNQSKRELDKLRKELEENETKKFGIPSAMLDVKKMFSTYTKKITGLSEMREMYLRTSIYNQVLNEIKNNGKVRNYGTVQRKAVESIINEANAQTDPQKKLDLQRQASLVFANQALIMYDDLSKASNNLSTFGMPFIRFAEGNVRAHFRMFNNFYQEYREAIKSQNYNQVGKTTARVAGNTAIMMSLPIAIWNAINMAIFGIDDEEIPEYAKENGYFMLGNTFVSNTDVFSDFASNFGLDNLRYNLTSNIKDKGLVNGMIQGLSDSVNAKQSWDDRIANYVSPIIKAPFEYITAMDLYPDGVSYVGNSYSKSQNAIRKSFQVLGLDRIYEMAHYGLDKNAKMYKENPLEWFGFKITGDDMNEYFLARDNAISYGEEMLGNTSKIGVGYETKDPKQKLRYNIYKAIKNQDDEFAFKLFNEYVGYTQENTSTEEEFNKEIQSLKQSLATYFDVIPTHAIPKKEYENYVLSLNDDEFERLQNAYINQEELLGAYYGFIYGE